MFFVYKIGHRVAIIVDNNFWISQCMVNNVTRSSHMECLKNAFMEFPVLLKRSKKCTWIWFCTKVLKLFRMLHHSCNFRKYFITCVLFLIYLFLFYFLIPINFLLTKIINKFIIKNLLILNFMNFYTQWKNIEKIYSSKFTAHFYIITLSS